MDGICDEKTAMYLGFSYINAYLNFQVIKSMFIILMNYKLYLYIYVKINAVP